MFIITKQIKQYKTYIESVLAKTDITEDEIKAVCEDMLIKIGFYSHERLVHLIVTMTFAVLTVLSIIAVSLQVYFIPLAVLFLVLEVPYIQHYWFLENSVQQLYIYYDRICEMEVVNENIEVV